MIKKLYIFESNCLNPFENLAREEYMLRHLPTDSIILYLWQNAHTVVIGKNQNAWQECKVQSIEKDGGFLARRLSGGGAVFHDLGNLNFTFIVGRSDYSIPKQLEVILKAVNSFGLEAIKSGRNDLTVADKKFSGNAFYQNNTNAYHHGTLLISADMQKGAQYLNVSQHKLHSHSVQSVRSRVTNLEALCSEVTIPEMKIRLIKAFKEIYAAPSIDCELFELDESFWDSNELMGLTEKYASQQWRFGQKIPFSITFTHRFTWGEITLQLQVEKGQIHAITIYSDAMECDLIAEISQALMDIPFNQESMRQQLGKIQTSNSLSCSFREQKETDILMDLQEWILNLDI